jgi:hypothetical protein
MSALATDDYDGDLRVARVYEPAAGSARQLLQFSGLSHDLAGQDIDPICIQISLVNGSLYAPWITFPLPTSILQTTRVAEVARPAVDGSHPKRPHVTPVPEATAEPEEASGGGQPAEYRQSSLFDL